MKNLSVKILLLLLTICGGTYAQSSYMNVQISNQFGPNEVTICINPKNTNQIAAGANLNSYYYSTNGGFNWTRGTLTSSSYGVWGDPCIVADTNGAFYYFHLSNPPSGGSWIDRIVCQKSTNGGLTYSNPGTYTFLNPPKKQDKEWACVERRPGSRGNWIYVTWTQFDAYGSSNPLDSSNILFSRSTDGGLTWNGGLRINRIAGNCLDRDSTVEGAVPCVGPNGEIYVSWSGTQWPISPKIFFDKSTDGGNMWLANDVVVTDQPGGWDYDIPGIQRCNGLPITTCDVSNGPYNGTVYINWTDQRNGTTDTDVWLIKSTNGGNNWSAPIRVNDDAPGKQQFFTWMTIDQITGYIYIIFYDRRNYSDNQTDVYMARSTNGGASFVNERISASPFVPTTITFFGDYNNISAHNGKIRPMWTRLVSGALSVWTAIIDFPVGTEQTHNQIPNKYYLGQNFPNPFNAVTRIDYSIPENSQIIIKVFDALGREVSVLVSGNKHAGEYSVYWDATNYPSGIYYYTMEALKTSESGQEAAFYTKKMILVK